MIPAVISPFDATYQFPNAELALTEPNGLLAIGGDLHPNRILHAYRHGIFPWFSEDQPILWWSPDPRMVLFPKQLSVSRSLKKAIRKSGIEFTYDRAFTRVIFSCAQPRPKQPETWITAGMMDAYITLHKQGHAHSFEVWQDKKLIGGLYGIGIGQVFFGESMFSFQTNASKIAFVKAVEMLLQWDYALIDCQVESLHLQNFGARNIPRREFIRHISRLTTCDIADYAWQKSTSHGE